MRLASSCTVIVSGRTTSRTTFTPSARSSSSSCWRRSRSRWRRTLARLRVFSSSPSMAACTSMRPRRRPAVFFATGTGALRGGRAVPGRRRGASSSSPGRAGFSRSVSVGVAAVVGVAGRAGRRASSAVFATGWAAAAASAAARADSSARRCCSASAAARAAASAALAASLLAAARFLGGGEDRDLLLLAPLHLAAGGFSLLLPPARAGGVASSLAVSARPAPAGGRPGADGVRGAPWIGCTGPVETGAATGARFLRTST